MIEIIHEKGCITIKGHAGYAELGKDIVCSAISTLTEVFIASVEELTTDEIKCDTRAGSARIQYRDLTRDAQLLLNSFFVGCEMIANTYPDYVKLSRRGTL